MIPYHETISDESKDSAMSLLGAEERDYICAQDPRDIHKEFCQSGLSVESLVETVAYLLDRIKTLEARFK